MRIGWLGRDLRFKGAGLGEILVMDALQKTLESPIGVHAIFVDAIDEKAIQFYKELGFTPVIHNASSLFMPIKTAKSWFVDAEVERSL